MPQVLCSSVAVAALALTLAGCASQGNRPVEDYSGYPKGATGTPDESRLEPFASWLSGGDRLALTLYGSSTCPPTGERLNVQSPNWLDARLVTLPPDTVCTMDYVPHTTVFDTPAGVSSRSDVTITVQGRTITLPALR
ncbi:hypothetical protein WDJ51_03995 [Rathayibacter sp. YIM 133350]|uniref:hypothetical protein n=1 Tax=Rathayibacter sp. YIM 133350 TaxID=3131992 RepID=UPI00307D6DC4